MSAEDRAAKRIEDLERRLRVHPEDAELVGALVDAYTSAGRYLQAADFLEARINASSSPDWKLIELFCASCRNAGRAERAIELLDRVKGEHRSRATFWTLRGRMGEDAGQLEQARGDHETACRYDPESADARFRLGVTLMKLHRDEEAVACFERCLDLDPAMTKAQINIGVLLDQAGQPEKAIEAFRRAIEANPTSVESHCNLGAAYGDLGRKKDAVAEFRRALEIDANCALARWNLGVALMDDYPEEAMIELKKAQTLDPGNWDINYNLGLSYFRKGMYDLASRLLEHCVQARPDSVQALYYLGVTYNKKDQPGLAIEQLDRVLALDPQNWLAHSYLGVAYDKKGQFEQARVHHQAAARLRGNSQAPAEQ